jgi:hypothetical protein
MSYGLKVVKAAGLCPIIGGMAARRFVSPPTPALEELYRRDQEAGGDPLENRPPPPGPRPDPPQPLVPVIVPPPDWRAEEEERAWRAARDEAGELDEPGRQRPDYPAAKQKKNTGATPRLDEVKAWRGEQQR